MRDVTISVVIPTYNEEKCIENCLSSVMNGSVSPLEIIVADGGSSDKTVEIAKRMGAIVICISVFVVSFAVNFAVYLWKIMGQIDLLAKS